MSSVSYATAVTGSPSTASAREDAAKPVTDSAAAAATAGAAETSTGADSEAGEAGARAAGSAAEASLPSPSPSPSPNPKAKAAKGSKKDEQPNLENLSPAPVPVVNAWGESSSRSNSNVGSETVDSKHWPSPNEVPPASEANAKKQQPQHFVKVSSKEKWVPFKAAVVLPSPSNPKKNSNAKKNANKTNNKSNDKKRKSAGSNSKRPQSSKESKDASSRDSASKDTSKNEEKASASALSSSSSLESTPEQSSSSAKKPAQHSTLHPHPNLNPSTAQPFVPGQFQIPNQNHTQPRHFKQHYKRPSKYNNQAPPMMYNKFINPIPGPIGTLYQNGRRSFTYQRQYDILTPLIKQIEYYLSIENLVKDLYLRSQMNSQGWFNLSVISNFNRMNILCGGDLQLIRSAIDELNGSLLEIGYFPNDIVKIRVKDSFSTWVLPAEQRQEAGKDESEPLTIVAKQVSEPAQPEN